MATTAATTAATTTAVATTAIATAATTTPATTATTTVTSTVPTMATPDPDALHTKPWRNTVLWDTPFETSAQLRNDIENYSPLSDIVTTDINFPHVDLMMLGPVNAGKSSFFNTVNSAFRQKIFDVARSGSSAKSLTTKFNRYKIISSETRKPLPFRMCDMRGFEPDHLMTRENCRYVMEGNIPDRSNFDASSGDTPSTPGFEKYPPLDARIQCCIIFLDASTFEAMSPEVTQNIKDCQVVMNSLEIQQVVVLTKIDNICKYTKEHVANAFRSPIVERCVNKVSEEFGLPRNSVFPMKNYESECAVSEEITIITLMTLKEILNKADATLFNHYDELMEKYAISKNPKKE